MEIVRTVAALRERVQDWRRAGEAVAFAPTMGALHDGHLSLLQVGRATAPRVVASLFVNPTQFGPAEDFGAYPRDERSDAAMLERAGCDLLYAPPVEEMYPPDFSTQVRVTGLTDCLCGRSRPGHMDGVAQVVTKLLNQAQADYAVFGEKDWQQLVVIRRLVRDLDIPTRIVGAPIVREPDGLAMSSRNRYLSEPERRIAGRLNRVLARAAGRIAAGEPVLIERVAAKAMLIQSGFDSVDYLDIRAAETLEPVTTHDSAVPSRVFAAVRIGRTRLVDNRAIAP